MPKIVESVDSALEAIRRLNDSLCHHPELASRLGQAHAFYVLETAEGPMFGFSKFVGYEGLTAEEYLSEYKNLSGINTEHALARWFDEVTYDTPAYRKLFDQLAEWMAGFGKRPRSGMQQKLRIMVVRPGLVGNNASTDRKLLELLIAVAETLPLSQRHELRAAL